MSERNWIILTGQPVDTTHGGGFEFHGPYTEEEAQLVRSHCVANMQVEVGERICMAIQLISANWPTKIMQAQRVKEDSTHH